MLDLRRVKLKTCWTGGMLDQRVIPNSFPAVTSGDYSPVVVWCCGSVYANSAKNILNWTSIATHGFPVHEMNIVQDEGELSSPIMNRQDVGIHQGNLKGESVVAAILPSPSRMEVSYSTSGFFVAKPAQQVWVAFPMWT